MPTVCFAPLVVLAVAGAPAPCPREFDPRSAPIERSVEAAVYKAQPLPYAGFESVFSRELELSFRAEDN